MNHKVEKEKFLKLLAKYPKRTQVDIVEFLNFVVCHDVQPYDSEFGDDQECMCGHSYYRHFDSYDDNYPIGCKYCDCPSWREPKP